MIPAAFDYYRPNSIPDVIALLEEHGDEARVMAGGHSLIPMMRLRLVQPGVLIDLRKLDTLTAIEMDDGHLRIGGAATHDAIQRSSLVKEQAPLFVDTARQIGDVQVRNVGTIGGSIAHADPAGDWPAALLATEATMVLAGPGGLRDVAAADFFVGLFESAIEAGEILTAVRVAASAAGTGAAYLKSAQSASGFALAGAAAQLTLDGDTIGTVRIGITGVGENAYRASAVEEALTGTTADEATVRAACQHATDGLAEVLSDTHAAADYRRHLATVMTRRAVLAAASIARGGAA